MIPIHLTIQGLYSYQEKQTIDFQNLTEAGLFGIFGTVGSGKSSILEAISFALYGETERLNSRDKRAYNMMNLKSNRSFLEFDFLNFENKKFRVSREFKRNSKNFEDVKSQNSIFYKWENEKWIPLEHLNTEEIVGLSYANFKRTIIIPQGQFKEFIELGATERTNMMKEIFDLYRFDLQNNVSLLHSRNRDELSTLEGQLLGFEEVNAEKIESHKDVLKNETEKFDTIKFKFEKIKEKHQKLKNLKTDFDLLKLKEKDFAELAKKKTEIDGLEKKIDEYEKIFRIFNPMFLEKNRTENDLKLRNAEKEKENLDLKEIEQEYKIVNDDLIKIEPFYKDLKDSKVKENDLGLMVQILKSKNEIRTLEERTKNGKKIVDDIEINQNKISEKITDLNSKNSSLKLKKLDSHLLMKTGNWFSEQKNLKNSEEIQLKKIADHQKKIAEVIADLKPFEIDIKTYKSDFETKITNLENQKKGFSEIRNQVEVQKKLAHFSDELHDGASCPLCGSLEHPSIAKFEDTEMELEKILNQIKDLEKEILEIQNQSNLIEKILEKKTFFEEQLKLENELLNGISIKQEEHIKNFVWKEFKVENELEFEKKRSQSFAIEKEIESLNDLLKKEEKQLETERANFSKYNKILEDFKLQEKEVETQIKSNVSNLKLLKFEEFVESKAEEIQILYQDLAKQNQETEENFLQLTAKEKELSPKLAAQKTTVFLLEKRISDLNKEISENENLIKNTLISNNFTEFNQISHILEMQIDVQKHRNEIQKYRIDFTTLKNGIEELKLKLKDFTFDEETYSVVENQFKNLEKELNLANDSVVKIKAEIERLKKEFDKKEKLLVDLAKLQKRAENLKIMTALFKGAGFVQYVSSIYLRQLCDHANVRFHRMTRNQLSLQLNENNDFEIIDYLNEGRCRSVKTLSGGQAFQVSLSLALALAETVQAKTATEKNFFFIDEGFGTQDSESVNIVFETLMGLQKENRIVGIISHVEELKEKIPVSLQITKDEERGSLIEVV